MRSTDQDVEDVYDDEGQLIEQRVIGAKRHVTRGVDEGHARRAQDALRELARQEGEAQRRSAMIALVILGFVAGAILLAIGLGFLLRSMLS